jgi:hypothetical protein
MFNNVFLKSCRLLDVWKNIVERDRRQMTVWRMRIACCTTTATTTQSEYAILSAFPQQQWLHERVSLLVLLCATVNNEANVTVDLPQWISIWGEHLDMFSLNETNRVTLLEEGRLGDRAYRNLRRP